jgi:hypothetical protein
VAGGFRLQFGGRQPQRTDDAFIQLAGGMVLHRLRSEREAQVMAAGLRCFPLVSPDERGKPYIPAGFLQRLAQRRFEQALVRFEVAGRLIEHPPAAGVSSTISRRPSLTTTVATVTSGCQKRPFAVGHRITSIRTRPYRG